MEDIDWRNSLLTSLYSQVEFLKEEINVKNGVNATLLELIKSYQIKQGDKTLSGKSTQSSFTLNHSIDDVTGSDVHNSTETESREVNMITLDDVQWSYVGKNRNQVYNQSSAVNHNIMQLGNFYAPLSGEEIIQDETVTNVNDFDPAKIDKRNITIRRKGKVNHKPVNNGIHVNQHPENDQLLLRGRSVVNQTYPGNSSYAHMVTRGEKVCILSDSLCKPIDMNEFNRVLKKGYAIKRFYPGATASQIKFYVDATLEEDRPDSVIILVGTNNITKKRTQVAKDIVHEILEIVHKCRNNGVNNVFVSGLISRPQYQKMINEINELLRTNAGLHHYEYISSSNIEMCHLWSDNHLNKEGTVLLANNFLNSLNNTTSGVNHY